MPCAMMPCHNALLGKLEKESDFASMVVILFDRGKSCRLDKTIWRCVIRPALG